MGVNLVQNFGSGGSSRQPPHPPRQCPVCRKNHRGKCRAPRAPKDGRLHCPGCLKFHQGTCTAVCSSCGETGHSLLACKTVPHVKPPPRMPPKSTTRYRSHARAGDAPSQSAQAVPQLPLPPRPPGTELPQAQTQETQPGVEETLRSRCSTCRKTHRGACMAICEFCHQVGHNQSRCPSLVAQNQEEGSQTPERMQRKDWEDWLPYDEGPRNFEWEDQLP